MPERACICIDLKSFYASVECAARHLDPMKACLLVAEGDRRFLPSPPFRGKAGDPPVRGGAPDARGLYRRAAPYGGIYPDFRRNLFHLPALRL